MKAKVEDTIRRYKMIAQGDTVIAAVSGGADSMCMLDVLCGLRGTFDFKIVVAHLNHLLRGEEARRDEAFVSDWCRAHDIECIIKRVEVARLSEQNRLGTEECGRRVRYAFFEEIAAGYPSAKIATAHTLSDQEETVLLHLARGSGNRGLCGIPPVRGIIIRPLIECLRSEVEAYCHRHCVRYMTDSTNEDVSYARNRIRHIVVPQLTQINPRFGDAILRTVGQLSDQEEYFERRSEDLLQRAEVSAGYETSVFRGQPEVIRLRCCLLAARKNGVTELTAQHAEMLDRICFNGGSCTLPGGIVADVYDGALRFLRPGRDRFDRSPRTISPPQKTTFGGRSYSFELQDAKFFFEDLKIHKKLVTHALNYDTISGSMVLRTRKSGDKFAPQGRGITKPVRKLFNEMKIPPEQRDCKAMLEADGIIVWIEGVGVSEQARILPDTEKILMVVEGTT